MSRPSTNDRLNNNRKKEQTIQYIHHTWLWFQPNFMAVLFHAVAPAPQIDQTTGPLVFQDIHQTVAFSRPSPSYIYKTSCCWRRQHGARTHTKQWGEIYLSPRYYFSLNLTSTNRGLSVFVCVFYSFFFFPMKQRYEEQQKIRRRVYWTANSRCRSVGEEKKST